MSSLCKETVDLSGDGFNGYWNILLKYFLLIWHSGADKLEGNETHIYTLHTHLYFLRICWTPITPTVFYGFLSSSIHFNVQGPEHFLHNFALLIVPALFQAAISFFPEKMGLDD